MAIKLFKEFLFFFCNVLRSKKYHDIEVSRLALLRQGIFGALKFCDWVQKRHITINILVTIVLKKTCQFLLSYHLGPLPLFYVLSSYKRDHINRDFIFCSWSMTSSQAQLWIDSFQSTAGQMKRAC